MTSSNEFYPVHQSLVFVLGWWRGCTILVICESCCVVFLLWYNTVVYSWALCMKLIVLCNETTPWRFIPIGFFRNEVLQSDVLLVKPELILCSCFCYFSYTKVLSLWIIFPSFWYSSYPCTFIILCYLQPHMYNILHLLSILSPFSNFFEYNIILDSQGARVV
jgi:hypothetical protein